MAVINAASPPPTLINGTSSERGWGTLCTHLLCRTSADPAVVFHLHTNTEEIQTSVPLMNTRHFCVCLYWYRATAIMQGRGGLRSSNISKSLFCVKLQCTNIGEHEIRQGDVKRAWNTGNERWRLCVKKSPSKHFLRICVELLDAGSCYLVQHSSRRVIYTAVGPVFEKDDSSLWQQLTEEQLMLNCTQINAVTGIVRLQTISLCRRKTFYISHSNELM